MELSVKASFTVVIANDDEDGRSALAMARAWHASGLLSDFAWVTPSSVHLASQGPALVEAVVVSSGQTTELLGLLGSRPHSLLRVIVLHMLTHEHSSVELLADACDHVADLVRRAMPVTLTTSGDGDGMRLLRTNLMVPESELAPQHLDILQAGWEVNALVSPEDRPDLNRVNVFVRRSSNLYGHALAAVASAGGLWRGAARGSFDDLALDSTMGGKELLVVRSMARIVVGDDRATRLAAAVIHAVETEDAGATSIEWGVPSDDPEALVTGALESILQTSEWLRRPLESMPLIIRQVSLGTLIRDWASFQLSLPVAAIGFVSGKARTAVERSVTAATVGKEAGVVGRVVPLSPSEAATVAQARLESLGNDLAPARLKLEAAQWGQSTPAAWRVLREFSIGLVDGSDLPAPFTRPHRAGLDEVLPPRFVVPHPDDVLVHAGETVSGVDVLKTAEVLRDLPPSDAAEKTSFSNDASSSGFTSPADETGEAGDHSSILDWVEQRKGSLLWRLATAAYETLRSEDNSAKSSLAAATDFSPPSTEKLQWAQRLLILSWFVGLVGVLLAPVWIIIKTRFTDATLPEVTWQNLSTLTVIVLLVWLGGGSFYFRTTRAYEWAVLQRLHRLRTASDEYVRAAQETKRWKVMYRGVVDWARILAPLLHRPWTASALQESPVEEHVDGLPASVALAQPAGDHQGPSPVVVSDCIQSICHRGWLKQEFSRYVKLSPINSRSSSRSSGDLAADTDLGLHAHGPRADLILVAETSETREEATWELMEDIKDLMLDGELELPEQTVKRVGAFATELAQSDQDFFTSSMYIQAPLAPDLFTDEAHVAGRNVPETSLICLPLGIPFGGSFPGANIIRGATFVAVRHDLSPQLQPSDVRIFERATPRSVGPRASVDEDYN